MDQGREGWHAQRVGNGAGGHPTAQTIALTAAPATAVPAFLAFLVCRSSRPAEADSAPPSSNPRGRTQAPGAAAEPLLALLKGDWLILVTRARLASIVAGGEPTDSNIHPSASYSETRESSPAQVRTGRGWYPLRIHNDSAVVAAEAPESDPRLSKLSIASPSWGAQMRIRGAQDVSVAQEASSARLQLRCR